MKVTILHTDDALEDPSDPVIPQLENALGVAGHSSSRVSVGSDVQSVVDALRAAAPELVVNIAESFGGKSSLESNVAALLNLLDLRYTGSSPAGLMMAGDKVISKKVLSFHGIRTAKFATAFRGSVDWAGDIAFPLIVKPPQEDASLGITSKSVVNDVQELLETMSEMEARYHSPVLVEEFVDGREFYVGVLGNSDPRALPVMELDFSGFPAGQPRIASWNAKWGEDGEGSGAEFAGTRSVFPDDLAAELVQRMQRAATDAFRTLRLRDYARVDLRVTPAGEVYVIEVNPNCYLEQSGEFARSAERGGLAYDALIAQIVDLAAARYSR